MHHTVTGGTLVQMIWQLQYFTVSLWFGVNLALLAVHVCLTGHNHWQNFNCWLYVQRKLACIAYSNSLFVYKSVCVYF